MGHGIDPELEPAFTNFEGGCARLSTSRANRKIGGNERRSKES